MFLHMFCMFLYTFSGFVSYKIDRVMGGGRLRRPPLINYQFYMKQIKKMHAKNVQKRVKIYNNI